MGGEQRTEWWLDGSNVAALYRWMVDNDYLDGRDVAAVEWYLRHPHRYSPEWALMTTGKLSSSVPAPSDGEAEQLPTGKVIQ